VPPTYNAAADLRQGQKSLSCSSSKGTPVTQGLSVEAFRRTPRRQPRPHDPVRSSSRRTAIHEAALQGRGTERRSCVPEIGGGAGARGGAGTRLRVEGEGGCPTRGVRQEGRS
jgi:hypothetical protein